MRASCAGNTYESARSWLAFTTCWLPTRATCRGTSTRQPAERAKDLLVVAPELRLRVRVAELVQHRDVLAVWQPHLTQLVRLGVLLDRVDMSSCARAGARAGPRRARRRERRRRRGRVRRGRSILGSEPTVPQAMPQGRDSPAIRTNATIKTWSAGMIAWWMCRYRGSGRPASHARSLRVNLADAQRPTAAGGLLRGRRRLGTPP